MITMPPKVTPQKSTALMRELMAMPGVIDCPSIFDPISQKSLNRLFQMH